jgi:putative phage-type endonuclease
MIYQEVLDRVAHVETDTMSYEEWLEKRKSSIGGSDAGAIMGYVGEWGSPLTVFLQKTGRAVSKEMSVAAKRGKILEPVVREYFKEEYPALTVEKVPYILYHPKYPFISANLDGIIDAGAGCEVRNVVLKGLGGLEIKSSKSGYGYSEDEIPDGHYCQVQHYMAVTGFNWFILEACFLETEEFKTYVILRNEKFIEQLIQQEINFWNNHIVTDEWPAAIGIDAEEEFITGIFTGGGNLVLGDEEKRLCQQYVEAQRQYKEAEETKKRISTTIKEILVQKQSGAGEKKISAIAGGYSISWSRFETSRIDTDALRKAGLYDKYAKKSETGRLTITEKKAG